MNHFDSLDLSILIDQDFDLCEDKVVMMLSNVSFSYIYGQAAK